ncbi:MAG: TlpA disulfide reductase family protein [Pseudomonadota bacterium]|nr:TlpA disulfide reductase family protein [Pseudomonadota bacterium]
MSGKQQRILINALALAMALFGAIGSVVAADGPAVSADEPAVSENNRARQPSLEIATIEGGSFKLSAHRGTWVVVNFWATWCPPCIKEMPELSALDAERKDVSVVGLAFEEIDLRDLQAFVSEHPVVYPIALVDVYNPPADFDTPRGLPLTYLVAPDGSIAEKIMGPVTRAELEKMIAADR